MTATRIPFSLRDLAGEVSVELGVNDDPAYWGYGLLTPGAPLEDLIGFPVCTAHVTYPAAGYAAMLGWVQVVQSTDSHGDPSVFELDPIHVYRDLATPFAWFGLTPTLFDAPSRDSKYAMRWRARSYLCAIPDAVVSQEVSPVVGFGWGFDCDGSAITLVGAAELPSDSWEAHLPMLRHTFPTWTFHEGPSRQ